jgi:MurNAc alpha-1-phosphate uridylyltransferase
MALETTVMLMAAGRGERMRPLTDTVPKALLHAGAHRLIEYHLLNLSRHGFRRVVINLAHLGDQIEAVLGDGRRYGVDITYSREGARGLETGGGIQHALPLLGPAPFMVVNADIYTDFPFDQLPPRFTGPQAHLVLVDNPVHHPEGDFTLRDGRVSNHGRPRFTYSGIGMYHPSLFVGCRPGVFSLAPLLRHACDETAVSGEHYGGTWMDVGTPERLSELNKRLGGAPTKRS